MQPLGLATAMQWLSSYKISRDGGGMRTFGGRVAGESGSVDSPRRWIVTQRGCGRNDGLGGGVVWCANGWSSGFSRFLPAEAGTPTYQEGEETNKPTSFARGLRLTWLRSLT